MPSGDLQTKKNFVNFIVKKQLDTKDYDEIIKLANHSLSDFPFDLRQLNFLELYLSLKGNEEHGKNGLHKIPQHSKCHFFYRRRKTM